MFPIGSSHNEHHYLDILKTDEMTQRLQEASIISHFTCLFQQYLDVYVGGGGGGCGTVLVLLKKH